MENKMNENEECWLDEDGKLILDGTCTCSN